MKQTPITQAVQQFELYKRYFETTHLRIGGVIQPTLQTLLVSDLLTYFSNYPHAESPSAILWYTNEYSQSHIQLLLQYWQQFTQHTYHCTTLATDPSAWYARLLNNQPTLLIGTHETLTPLLAQPADENIGTQSHRSYTLMVGKEYNPIQIQRDLVAADYVKLPEPEYPGTLSQTGGLLKIWLHGFDGPVHCSFDGNILEKVTWPTTANAQKHLVIPLTNNHHHIVEMITSCVYDTTGINTSPPALPACRHQIRFVGPHDQIDINLPTTSLSNALPASTLHKRLQQQQPQTIIHATNGTTSPFVAADVHTIAPFVYLESLLCPALSLGIIALETAQTKKSTTSKQAHIGFAQELQPGDIVVHQDHGICHFTGMSTHTIDGIQREYLQLEFAQQDKIYVPILQLNKIAKYIGQANPTINRLSSSSWSTTVKKISHQTIALAHQLIEIYAKRQLAHVSPLSTYPEEAVLAEQFPHELTKDQQRAWNDIERDITSGHPMDRLLCGDVAFGKTELALRTAFKAVLGNGQVAILAPTTILVQQHYDFFISRLSELGVRVGLLSRWRSSTEQKQVLKELATGTCDIVIGTHRILSRDVRIPKLSLLIIDEEQKFGVAHKELLRKRRPNVHTLALSATPIPRTLQFSLSGLRDISIIQTPPAGRLPVKNTIQPHDDTTIQRAIRAERARGGQIYYLIRKVQEIPTVLHRLQQLVPECVIGIAHGQLPPQQLAAVMSDFDHGTIDVLLCSTIIENGLDLPNANTLIVDNAAHFGLSQLYQLRGRIGRGTAQAYAYFMFHRQKLTGIAAKRLQALENAYQLGAGFDVALKDVEIRGSGNLLGKEQHGQIAAIGMALYAELLEDAVQYLKDGELSTDRVDVQIDLPINATIPESVIPHPATRIKRYQQLARITDTASRNEYATEHITSPWPIPFQNLLLLFELKDHAARLNIHTIDAAVLRTDPFNARIRCTITAETNTKALAPLFNNSGDWDLQPTQLTVHTTTLGDQWLETLVTQFRNLTS